MNIVDVIKLNGHPMSVAQATKGLVDARMDRQAAKRLFDREVLRSGDTAHVRVWNGVSAKYDDERVGFLQKHWILPDDDIFTTRDPLSLAACAPKVETKEIRRIANILGFVVFPVAYMHELATQGERGNVKRAVAEFSEKMGMRFDIYVLGPITYYSLEAHVTAEKDMPVFAGKDIASALTAVSMTIPVFRTVKREMAALRASVQGLDERLRNTDKEIAGIVRRLNEMQARVEEEKAERVRAEVAKKKREMEALENLTRFVQYEPLMFALEKGKTVSDDVTAILGPCWGPDFDDIVMTALGLPKIQDQREKVNKLTIGAWDPGY